MAESIVALFAEAIPLVARGVGAVLAAVAGTSVELNGLHRIMGDPSMLGLWVVWVGILLFLVCYVLATDLSGRLRTPESA